MKSLLIRADADASIGTGHVMRCLALGQHVQEQGGNVMFAVAHLPSTLEKRLQREGIAVRRTDAAPGSAEDARGAVRLAEETGGEWIVIDGYALGATYQRRLQESGARILAWDDYGHADHYYADLVLNQNISADRSLYGDRELHTRLLLGTEYAVLRREFRDRREARDREQPDVARRLLVTLGGGDPDNVTATVLEALNAPDVPDLDVRVVVGSASPHEAAVREASRRSRQDVTVLRNVGGIAGLMGWADAAVSAGGSTCWELTFFGVPNVVIVASENQRAIAEGLARAGASINVGSHADLTGPALSARLADLLHDCVQRTAIAERGRKLVDGRGGHRVLERMRREETIALRAASKQDCSFLWKLVNDPAVRAASFHSDSIAMKKHEKWFGSKLSDPDCLLYIATDAGGEPIGQVRFDVENAKAVVSVSLVDEQRGKGYGARLIGLGSERLFNCRKEVRELRAFIKKQNVGSVRAFKTAGYKKSTEEIKNGDRAVIYVLERNPHLHQHGISQ